MRIGVVIPTRGDRPDLMKRSLYYLDRQSITPDRLEIVNHKPFTGDCDITQRFRYGITKLYKDVDIIIMWEDDDWYIEDFIAKTVELWEMNPHCEMIGFSGHLYYNINSQIYSRFRGGVIPPMATTSIASSYVDKMSWPTDTTASTDLYIWRKCNKYFRYGQEDKFWHIGIKHGIGKTVTSSHSRLTGTKDIDFEYLRANISAEDFLFYEALANGRLDAYYDNQTIKELSEEEVGDAENMPTVR